MNSAAKRVAGLVVELLGCPDLLDAPLVEQYHPVGHLERLVLIVGDEDGGDGEPLLELAQIEAHALAQDRVEIRQRLVEQQDRRLDHQRAGQGDPLALPPAELPGQPGLHTREPDQIEHPADAPADLGPRCAAHAQAERDIVETVL